MKFLYQARNLSGEVQQGKIEALNNEKAIAMLQEKGLLPLSIEKEKETPEAFREIMRIWNGASSREISVFFRQLATLIEAKVTIVSSLNAVREQTSNAYLKRVVGELVDNIEDGSPLSEAMQKHPDVFETLAVSMVKAGEISGNLQRSILFLAENTEKNYELSSKIRSAMFYPIFVLSAALIIGFGTFAFVLPKLTDVFKDLNVDIPWYTSMLMDASAFINRYWWVTMSIIIFIILSTIYYLRTEDGKREWDSFKMKLPVIGPLFQYIYIARFAENLSVLMTGGIPLVRGLAIVSEVVNSTVFESVILRAADEVKTGGSMSEVFSRSSSCFPPIVAQMIKIGEDSGKIAEVLKNVSFFYSKEVDRITRNLSSMLEPILISILGVGVGFLVFAILVPIYNIAGSI